MSARSIGIAIAALVLVGAFATRALRPERSHPLPAKAQAQYDNHRIATAVDTAAGNRLGREEATAKASAAAAATQRQRLEAVAAAAGRRADSLSAIARQVLSSADSSSWAWRLAYEARTLERDTLRRALDSAKAETSHGTVATAKADTTAAIDLRRADRADSLVTTLVDVATHPDQCKIAWVINCPTRTQALVAGVVVPIAAYGGYRLVDAVAKGRIKIPLVSIRF